jgi:hypothetical protein
MSGRTDNVVKNHFYSTLRRQLRAVWRGIFGETAAEPSEVSIESLDQLMKKHGVPLSFIDNDNVQRLLTHVRQSAKPEEVKEEKLELQKYRRASTRERKIGWKMEEDNEVEEVQKQSVVKKTNNKVKSKKRMIKKTEEASVECTPKTQTVFNSPPQSAHSDQVFLARSEINGKWEKIMSKKDIEDVELFLSVVKDFVIYLKLPFIEAEKDNCKRC